MFSKFFFELRETGVPLTLLEYLTFLESMKRNIAHFDIDSFYYLSRCCLIKDERNFDKFDKVFGSIFEGVEFIGQILEADIPEDWLKKLTERILSPQEMEQIEALGGWEELMKTLKERLAEQKKRHQGGSKMIGTAGTSPFGAYGYNPEGIRIGQNESRHKKAIKVWDKRDFKNLDDNDFIFKFIESFNFPKSTISRLKKGDRNSSDKDGELIWRDKLYFVNAKKLNKDLFVLINEIKLKNEIKKLKIRFIIVSDFDQFLAIDTKTQISLECKIKDLPKHSSYFLPLIGVDQHQGSEENPADLKAAREIGKLYDQLLIDKFRSAGSRIDFITIDIAHGHSSLMKDMKRGYR